MWFKKLGPKLFGPKDSYRRRVWLALDQLGNVVIFRGDEDETISSNAAKANIRGEFWGRALCMLLNWLDPGHCPRAIEPDEGKPDPRSKDANK